MDFITGLPRTARGFTVIWVIVDRLTKSAHFIPGKATFSVERWAELYMQEIVKLHGIPASIMSDRDPRFTLTFWRSLHKALETQLNSTTAFHHQTDGQTERLNQILEDMLRACVWTSTAQSRQKSYADVRRRALENDVGDHVFLRVAPVKGVLRFGMKGKLSPRFIGPFEIFERIGPVAYWLALPPSLNAVHNVFHVSMLRKYVHDPSHVLDYEPLQVDETLCYKEVPIEIVARETKVLRNRAIDLVKVLWRNYQVEEATWEREDEIRARYPELFERRTFEDESF
ncbi:uncharacterized protein LOC111022284 [Momordica charantia]|uniref:Uncharacterized protein LOC111022284 n=1 Tax=Momordica charantia TaxID=3673 RepID=A0A6J1DM68_MOMCH|nr:uncharacterized protein LOC111022284 [Momordica charantia]